MRTLRGDGDPCRAPDRRRMEAAGRDAPNAMEQQPLRARRSQSQRMDTNLDKARKPGKKLRKLLKDFPRDPSPQDVHALRTRTRELEAIVHALLPDNKPAMKLLKAMKPVRKAAGKVRDMDVLIANASTVREDAGQESMVKLVEHLAGLRRKHVDRLHDAIAKHKGKARKLLKRHVERIEEQAANNPGSDRIQNMAAELEHWPKLHKDNLHEFRKHAKELRNMLQLKADADRRAIDAFGRVKDTAGDWHDWLELLDHAEDVLDPKTNGAALKEIRETMREKLRMALTTANAIRRQGPVRLAA